MLTRLEYCGHAAVHTVPSGVIVMGLFAEYDEEPPGTFWHRSGFDGSTLYSLPAPVEKISSGPVAACVAEAAGAGVVAAMAGVTVSTMAVRPAPATLEIVRLVSFILVGCTASCSMRVPPVSSANTYRRHRRYQERGRTPLPDVSWTQKNYHGVSARSGRSEGQNTH